MVPNGLISKMLFSRATNRWVNLDFSKFKDLPKKSNRSEILALRFRWTISNLQRVSVYELENLVWPYFLTENVIERRTLDVRRQCERNCTRLFDSRISIVWFRFQIECCVVQNRTVLLTQMSGTQLLRFTPKWNQKCLWIQYEHGYWNYPLSGGSMN